MAPPIPGLRFDLIRDLGTSNGMTPPQGQTCALEGRGNTTIEGGRMFDGLCTNVGMRRIDPDAQLGRQGRLNLRQDRERHIKSRHEMCFSGR